MESVGRPIATGSTNDTMLIAWARGALDETGIMGGGQGAMMVKAALNALRLPAGPVRPPLVDATPEQVAQLRRDLAAGGIRL